MATAKKFFDWSYGKRGENVKQLAKGEMKSMEKMFLDFLAHEPAFISYGSAGLNASVKGVGFIPKDEYLEEVLEIYLEHIKTYKEGDKTYGERGLKILIDQLYSEEAREKIDFTRLVTLELAKKQSWTNYHENPEACLIFNQPPVVSYKLKGKIAIYDEKASGKREIYQQIINAQHDMYHTPNGIDKWIDKPAYVFTIEEVYDNSATKAGFGTKLEYPYSDEK